jgi:HEAT repeat protein
VNIGLSAAARALGEVAATAGAEAGRAVARAGRATASAIQSGRCRGEEDDERVMALNALLQMNSDDALPLLKQVLARRDTCSEILRRKAVFLVSQKRSADAAEILMETAKNDPDRETREQAVFWLGQVNSERSVALLEQILKTSNDEGMQDKALFALSQGNRGRGSDVLRDYAAREDAPEKLRESAIFWLGQRNAGENGAFLRGLFAKVRSRELKDKIIFSLSQSRSAENNEFLLDQAINKSNPMETRKSALFWAGQSGVLDVAKMASLYDKTDDQEFREQVIFVLSQKGRNTAAIDKLIDIAKNEKNRELREKAIFWLGQSRDAKALKALQDIILKSPEQE